MKRIGAFCNPSPSHVMGMVAIGCELQVRGHAVTIFQPATDRHSKTGLRFVSLGAAHEQFISTHLARLTRQQAYSVQEYLDDCIASARVVCDEAPRVLAEQRIDCVLADMAEPGAATVAEAWKVPFVTVCNALPLHQEPLVPPDFLPWAYRAEWWAGWRNRGAYRLRDFIIRRLHRTLNQYRRGWGLRPYRSPDDSASPFAQVTQLVPEFDFPRKQLPGCFHYVGPYRRSEHNGVPFPFERLDGRPLVYASLGTLHGVRVDLWQQIAEACAGLPAQLVIALGGQGRAATMPKFPGSPLVVDYAPQAALLPRASLVITHAGLNTALEALTAGVPMVALPINGDQFGVAARIAHSGAGETTPSKQLNAKWLREAVLRVLHEPGYRRNAVQLQAAIQATRGAAAAADIVEQVMATGQPALANRAMAAHA